MLEPDLAIIGAGSAGLSVAAGAAQMGASVVLIEKGRMGGDCLNYGCVPSKSVIAAAHTAHAVRHAGRFGVNGHEPDVDLVKVRDHLRAVIAGIEPNDSQERFESLGVTVLRGHARFTGEREIEAAGVTIRPRRAVVATGSHAAIPPLPGLADVDYLTNETVFELAERPERLIVVGGGPIGVELAQAHRRLGAAVTLVERFAILPKDDPDAVAVLREAIMADGVELREGFEVRGVERIGNRLAVALGRPGEATETLEGSHFLIAAGRRASLEGLELERAGIAYTPRGITVDGRLRTSNRRVFAIGDCAGGLQFTHMAGYHASVVVKQVLFRLPAKVDERAVPWVTYSDPELAQVGVNEMTAKEQGLDVTALRWPFEENDRARTEGATAGFVKVLVDRRGIVHGATIVGRHAGELVSLWVLVIKERIKIGSVAQMIAPYPTLSEASKRAAGAYYTPKLFSDRTRRLVRFLSRFG